MTVDDASMFVLVSIHHPHPEKEHLVIESMHRYGDESKRHKGLVGGVYTLKDESTGQLFGIAIWDSQESYLAARPP